MGDDSERIAQELAQIERDWEAAERLMKAMGLRDFLMVVVQIAKKNGLIP